MPNKVNIPSPPQIAGAEQIDRLWSWLFRVTEQLNVCLNSIDEDNLSSGVRAKLDRVLALSGDVEKVLESASGQVNTLDKATSKAITETTQTLEQLISDSSDAVRSALEGSIESTNDKVTAMLTHTHDEQYSQLGHSHTQYDLQDVFFRSGHCDFSASVGMNRQIYQWFPFERSFPAGVVPSVTITFNNTGTSTQFGRCFFLIPEGTVNEQGFGVRFFNGATTDYDIRPYFSYIAIGEVS